ncbi:MAG: hypothetical protein ABR499_00455 [Gemmatimonadaceae bacterium]
MMRTTILTLALFTAASSACNAQSGQQQQQRPAQQGENDPTRRAAGGSMPAGWQVRLDDKDATRYTANDVRFVPMGGGFHITSGPAAIYPGADLPNGEFVLEATFNQTQAPRHPEAYGLFFGGQNLDDSDKQEYVYFLVRGNGQFLINHRAGRDVHKIFDWTANAAIRKQNESGQASNQLTVRVGADSVRFLANGQQVAAISRQVISRPGGKAGLRVNHNLDLHVTSFRAVPGARQ